MFNVYIKFLFGTTVTILSVMGLFFVVVLFNVAMDRSERPELCAGLTADECVAKLQGEME